MELALRHVSGPTISAAHFLRIASADRAQRLSVSKQIGLPKPQKAEITAQFVEILRSAVYLAFLSSYIQGCNLIAKASTEECWKISLADCIFIWRSGCIIQSDYIADLLQPIFSKNGDLLNVLLSPAVAPEITRNFNQLKSIVYDGVSWGAYIPALSASLEWLKYCTGDNLPTAFMEAELDYFGAHAYDLKGEGPGQVTKGKHHTEWKPA